MDSDSLFKVNLVLITLFPNVQIMTISIPDLCTLTYV